MEGMGPKPENANGNGVANPKSGSTTKIALMPFAQAHPAVHVLDGSGKTYPARERSTEDDFQLMVQRLVADETAEDDCGGSRKKGPEADDGEQAQDGVTAADAESSTRKACSVESERKRQSRASGPANEKAASPAEHPLQQTINFFDMALGELNQLVHLLDLARAGEFMALERVTPKEEDQTKPTLGQSAKTGHEVPRGALTEMAAIKSTQLKGAADQLRQRAKRLRETTEVQKVFQQGVVHLRKNWRVVAPNHGKVDVPLQVGEALAVDCSFGSAGGQPVPSTQVVGSRHRHPWLFQIVSGPGGRLEEESRTGHGLETFEVQVVSAATGLCERSLRSDFSTQCYGAERETGAADKSRQKVVGSSGVRLGDDDESGIGQQLDKLEESIVRLHHSVFWHEMFETIKAEALVDGRNGWLAYHDARGEAVNRADQRSAVLDGGAANKRQWGRTSRRLIRGNARGSATSEQETEVYVVHVLDDEVMVKMDNQYLLGYKLISDGIERNVDKVATMRSLYTADGACAGAPETQVWGAKSLLATSKLALLYGGSLLRQHQQAQEDAGKAPQSHPDAGEEERMQVANDSFASSRDRIAPLDGPPSKVRLWASVGEVLRHQLFCKKVVRVLHDISFSVRRVGLPLTVRWTHLETTYSRSCLTVTLGKCFHFRVSLDDESRAVVSALPGLQNHADQRSVELWSADDLRQFILGEVCRQIVLTFGDITSAWLSVENSKRCHFKVDLAPAAIHLFGGDKARPKLWNSNSGGNKLNGSWEVRVYAEREVGVQIACSNWSSGLLTPNAQRDANNLQASGVTYADKPAALDPCASNINRERGLSVEEWTKLEGHDLFEKFSSLLAMFYPPPQTPL